MGQRFIDDSAIQDWQRSIFLCIDPQTARTLYASLIISMLSEAGVKVNEATSGWLSTTGCPGAEPGGSNVPGSGWHYGELENRG